MNRLSKVKSTIVRCISSINKLNLDIHPIYLKQQTEPAWLLSRHSFILFLAELPKISTPSSLYRTMFNEMADSFVADNWKFLFTDGSKSTNSTTFAIVNLDGSIITTGCINDYCSIFTAEALAILSAIRYASINKSKYVICSDSLSSILAIKNSLYESPIISEIRNYCIQNLNKIKIMWVPSHVGIIGNEYADSAAEDAKRRPLLKYTTWESQDILKYTVLSLKSTISRKWDAYQHNYKSVNPTGSKPIYPKNCSREETTSFVRLRIGHCKFSHQHLYDRTSPPNCPTCNTLLNVKHVLDDCTRYNSFRSLLFGTSLPSDLLKNTSDSNIKLINKFLTKTHLKNLV